ncbi:unnamed protein product [Periconia digitata]|uniref:Uncharacterized protein n=1 Tax=Periconia digitata TaxID=1303443 RepID=A0A9W4USJ2_9PLEO|nr:unnamed protein product [Periconia digitata]
MGWRARCVPAPCASTPLAASSLPAGKSTWVTRRNFHWTGSPSVCAPEETRDPIPSRQSHPCTRHLYTDVQTRSHIIISSISWTSNPDNKEEIVFMSDSRALPPTSPTSLPIVLRSIYTT